jgi:hypothetical protein
MARALEPFAGGLQFAPLVQGAGDNVAIAPGVDDALPLAAAQDASTQDTQASLDGFDNQETSFAPLPLPLRAAGKEQLQEPRLLRLAAMRNAPRSTLLLASGAVVSIGLVVAVWLATSSYSVASTQPSDAPSVAAPNLVVPAAVRAAQSDTPTAPDGWEAAAPAPSSTEPPAGKDEPTLSDDDYRPAPRQTSRRVVPAAPATRDAKARNNTALRIRRGDYR